MLFGLDNDMQLLMCLFWAADLSPPDNNPRENRITILFRDGSTVHLCANSEDESL